MKISINELSNLDRALTELENEKMNAILAYKFSKISKTVKNEMSTVEETRMKIISPYAQKDENGQFLVENNQYVIDEKDMAIVTTELNNLYRNEIEIDLDKIKIDEIKDFTMSNRQMEALMIIIED
jgi:hypothetical protein